MLTRGRVNDDGLIAIRGLNVSNTEPIPLEPLSCLGSAHVDMQCVGFGFRHALSCR